MKVYSDVVDSTNTADQVPVLSDTHCGLDVVDAVGHLLPDLLHHLLRDQIRHFLLSILAKVFVRLLVFILEHVAGLELVRLSVLTVVVTQLRFIRALQHLLALNLNNAWLSNDLQRNTFRFMLIIVPIAWWPLAA